MSRQLSTQACNICWARFVSFHLQFQCDNSRGHDPETEAAHTIEMEVKGMERYSDNPNPVEIERVTVRMPRSAKLTWLYTRCFTNRAAAVNTQMKATAIAIRGTSPPTDSPMALSTDVGTAKKYLRVARGGAGSSTASTSLLQSAFRSLLMSGDTKPLCMRMHLCFNAGVFGFVSRSELKVQQNQTAHTSPGVLTSQAVSVAIWHDQIGAKFLGNCAPSKGSDVAEVLRVPMWLTWHW